MSNEKKKKRNPKIMSDGIDFNYCPIHNIKIPKGGKCSQCEKEKTKSLIKGFQNKY